MDEDSLLENLTRKRKPDEEQYNDLEKELEKENIDSNKPTKKLKPSTDIKYNNDSEDKQIEEEDEEEE